MRRYSFFYHYNKPESNKTGRPVISIHYRGQCILVDNLICNVPTVGRIRKTQPKFVVTGKASQIDIEKGIATII